MSRPLGNFFHLGEAYTVFWAIVPLPILRAIQSPRLISLYRRLDFHFVTILNVSEVAASFVFGLIAVLYWRDWRGLVFSLLVGAAVRDVLTYWLFPHWPRLRFSLARAKTMLPFGLWFSFGTLCDFIAKQLDNLVVGHLLGPGALGNYQMAFRAGEMPVAEFTTAASVVTFPDGGAIARGPPRANAAVLVADWRWSALVGIAYAAIHFRLWPANRPAVVRTGLDSRGEPAQGSLHLRTAAGISRGRAKLSQRTGKTRTIRHPGRPLARWSWRSRSIH